MSGALRCNNKNNKNTTKVLESARKETQSVSPVSKARCDRVATFLILYEYR